MSRPRDATVNFGFRTMQSGRNIRENLRHSLRSLLLILPIAIIAIAILVGGNDRNQEVIESEGTIMLSTTADVAESDTISTPTSTTLRPFNPNTASYRTLIDAGLPRDVAVSIIRWREAGKVYRIKEDLALCHNMTDSLYFALEPYIIIDNEHRLKPKKHNTIAEQLAPKYKTWAEPRPFCLDTVDRDFLREVGFSLRQAELILRYRDIIGNYRSIEEFEECYGVDSTMAARLAPYITFPARDTLATPSRLTLPIDINSADSTTLCLLDGIGAKSAQRIIQYRELLGGYYDTKQILEIDIIQNHNFLKFSSQIYCDSCGIKKISINFAGQNELMVHPYLSNRMLRRIIKQRELKGGWSTIDEMIEDDIFSEEEAAKIAPYLDFGTNPK